MKNTFKTLFVFVIALLVFIPTCVFAAVIELDEDDFGDAISAGGEYTDKGLASINIDDDHVFMLKSGEYKLTEDIDLEADFFYLFGVDVILDLNGHTISNYSDFGLIISVNANITFKGNGVVDTDGKYDWGSRFYGGTITIENGSFNQLIRVEGADPDAVAMQDIDAITGSESNRDYAKLIINGGTFELGIHTFYTKSTINGGTFGTDECSEPVLKVYDYSILTINDGDFISAGLLIDDNGILEEQSSGFIINTGNEIIINDGNFISKYTAILYSDFVSNGETMVPKIVYTINGGTFEGGQAALIVERPEGVILKGGTFKGAYAGIVAVGADESIFDEMLASGYKYSPELVSTILEADDEEEIYAFGSQTEISVIKEVSDEEEESKVTYKVISGDGQTYDVNSDKELSFEFSTPYAEFKANGRVLVDGKVVDPKNYKATEGSTIITFTKEYVKANLKDGKHTVTIETDIAKVSASFTIMNNPKTGDNIALYVGLLAVSIVGFIGAKVFIKKHN